MKANDSSELPVQILARRLRSAVLQLIASARAGIGNDMCWQLEKTANSVVLNVNEGVSSDQPAQKARYYRIAKASAGECLGGLRAVHQDGRILSKSAQTWLGHGMGHARQVIGQLNRLIRYHDHRPP